MELKLIGIKEFKKDVYKHYKRAFPRTERKSYKKLKCGYYNKNTTFYKVIEKNNFVGFIITQTLSDNKCVLLDYLTILPEYQSKGLGKEAIKILKELLNNDYYGIFIEVEKAGCGKTQEENEIRERRIKFYEKIGFINLKFDIKLFNILLSAYILPITEELEIKQKIIKDIFDIYIAILGEKRANKYCKLLEYK